VIWDIAAGAQAVLNSACYGYLWEVGMMMRSSPAQRAQSPSGWLLVTVVSAALALGACVASHPMQVLMAPPTAAYSTLGMVTGQGPNEQSAVNHAMAQAENLDADAIIIVHRQPRGRQIWITARAIKYHRRPVSY
jgi:hypothetical protein